MQGTMSKNLYEALMKMQIRGTLQLPRRSANLWSDMTKLRLCKAESAYEISIQQGISKQRYGIQTEGNPITAIDRMKSNP
jgi:hypothetical protein